MRTFLATAAAVLLASTACGQFKTNQTSTTGVQTTTIAPAAPAAGLDDARRIARDEAIKMVKTGKALWVDVRPKTEYDTNHIKGAINIPLAELPQHMDKLPKKFLITYCA